MTHKGSGFPLQFLLRFAPCGISAAIPHALCRIRYNVQLNRRWASIHNNKGSDQLKMAAPSEEGCDLLLLCMDVILK